MINENRLRRNQTDGYAASNARGWPLPLHRPCFSPCACCGWRHGSRRIYLSSLSSTISTIVNEREPSHHDFSRIDGSLIRSRALQTIPFRVYILSKWPYMQSTSRQLFDAAAPPANRIPTTVSAHCHTITAASDAILTRNTRLMCCVREFSMLACV